MGTHTHHYHGHQRQARPWEKPRVKTEGVGSRERSHLQAARVLDCRAAVVPWRRPGRPLHCPVAPTPGQGLPLPGPIPVRRAAPSAFSGTDPH